MWSEWLITACLQSCKSGQWDALPYSTSNFVLSYVAVWPSRSPATTARCLAACPGFPGSPRQLLWVGKKMIQGNGIYPEQGVSMGYVCSCASTLDWFYHWTKCETEKAQERQARAGFTPSSRNAIIWCFLSEKFIMSRNVRAKPREEMCLIFRCCSCWPSPTSCKWNSITLQSQVLTNS